jgi:hypothetical protein
MITSNCRKTINLNFLHARIPLVKEKIRPVITYSDVFPEIKNIYFNVHAEGLFLVLLHTVETMSCEQKDLDALGIMNQYNEEQSGITSIN